MAAAAALATPALYPVLLSNGLRHSKNLPVKFGFSPIDTPANIAKKLPSQRCSQPLFNFSHKRPTFAFTSESGHTLGSRRKIAHNGLHAETRVFQMGVVSLPLEMSRNVQSGNTQNLKSMVIQRSFPKWSVAERRKTAAASDQAAVCVCAHSRYFAGGSPSGLRV